MKRMNDLNPPEEIAAGLDVVSVEPEVVAGFLNLFLELRSTVVRVKFPCLSTHVLVGAIQERTVYSFCNLQLPHDFRFFCIFLVKPVKFSFISNRNRITNYMAVEAKFEKPDFIPSSFISPVIFRDCACDHIQKNPFISVNTSLYYA